MSTRPGNRKKCSVRHSAHTEKTSSWPRKCFARLEPGTNKVGLSRRHIVEACEASLRRLGTGYIDLYQAHNFDSLTPLDETLRAFEDLVRAGKIRYAGCSNYSGWQLMKAMSISDRLGISRYISQQINYSLLARDCEHELVPAGLDQADGHHGLESAAIRAIVRQVPARRGRSYPSPA